MSDAGPGYNRGDMKYTRFALVATLGLLGCEEAKAPVVILRPLEERRVHGIIERVINENGAEPRPGKTFPMGKFSLHEDAHVGDSPYGIAYLSEDELKDAGDHIPPFDPERSDLRLVRPDEHAVVLVLYADAYRYDVGEEHSETVVTAEKMLERDVSDFIVHVVKMRK